MEESENAAITERSDDNNKMSFLKHFEPSIPSTVLSKDAFLNSEKYLNELND